MLKKKSIKSKTSLQIKKNMPRHLNVKQTWEENLPKITKPKNTLAETT